MSILEISKNAKKSKKSEPSLAFGGVDTAENGPRFFEKNEDAEYYHLYSALEYSSSRFEYLSEESNRCICGFAVRRSIPLSKFM